MSRWPPLIILETSSEEIERSGESIPLAILSTCIYAKGQSGISLAMELKIKYDYSMG